VIEIDDEQSELARLPLRLRLSTPELVHEEQPVRSAVSGS
jgi:hypothetical protein